MTDTLKALKEAAEQSKLIAENLTTQTRAAFAAAAHAQSAYIAAEIRLQDGNDGDLAGSAQKTTAEEVTKLHGNPVVTPEDYHRDRIAKSEAAITNLEHELAEERDRLDIYKQNLLECQSGEDLSRHVERDRRAEFWLEQLQTKYRNYPESDIAIVLDKARFSSIDLCYLVVDMAGIIKAENRKNIDAIFKLVDCNGTVTTPGFDPKHAAILQQIWNRPFDTNSRTIKPVNIQHMTDRFALELSFQKTLDIIRHCATVEHTRRSVKNKSDEREERNRRIIEEWEQHPKFHRKRMMSKFCEHFDTLGIKDASKSTIGRVIKKHLKTRN
ncbi:hypothetical protein [Pseudescherichia sp.]|uniref:hypothetical protein n=1 Tax=Pseudescherichia sp. TaxID=2055881 RepID=UPI0028AAB6A4|nr:hypothetical protein [Pseudescherichia sp.]